MKAWYFNDTQEILGPYSVEEIKSILELREIVYLWRSGLNEWQTLNFDDVIGIERNAGNLKETNMPTFQKEKPKENINKDVAGVLVKISGILMIILGAMTLFGSMSLFLFSEYYSNYLLVAYNFIIGLVFVFIGIGLMKFNKTVYNWGIGSSILSLILTIFNMVAYNNYASVIDIIFYIFIIISLYKSKYLFE